MFRHWNQKEQRKSHFHSKDSICWSCQSSSILKPSWPRKKWNKSKIVYNHGLQWSNHIPTSTKTPCLKPFLTCILFLIPIQFSNQMYSLLWFHSFKRTVNFNKLWSNRWKTFHNCQMNGSSQKMKELTCMLSVLKPWRKKVMLVEHSRSTMKLSESLRFKKDQLPNIRLRQSIFSFLQLRAHRLLTLRKLWCCLR